MTSAELEEQLLNRLMMPSVIDALSVQELVFLVIAIELSRIRHTLEAIKHDLAENL